MSRDNTPEIGKWNKQKQYRCRLCAFDTLDKAQFEDHFAKVHAPLQVLEGFRAKQLDTDVPADSTSDKEN